MNELHAISQSALNLPESIVATLVKAEGSSYRRPGARLLWTEAAGRIGSISGGCLEEDLIEHGRNVLRSGIAKTVVYDTTRENDLVWGTGLGCNGVVHVLVEPSASTEPVLAFVSRAWSQRRAAVVVTVFRANAEMRLGSAFALVESGETWQSREPSAPVSIFSELARRCLESRRSFTQELTALPGSPEVFLEYLPPPISLLIFGAGDDAQPLARMAATLGWEVTVTDPRNSHATAARFPEASSVFAVPPEKALAQLPFDARTAAVVMTHHYVHDLPLLRGLLPKNLPYLGLLGPKKRAERILREIADEGLLFTPDMRAGLHAPVGLDLGTSTPQEVALSILAEIQTVFHHGTGQPLRDRGGPIHRE